MVTEEENLCCKQNVQHGNTGFYLTVGNLLLLMYISLFKYLIFHFYSQKIAAIPIMGAAGFFNRDFF